MKELEKYTYIKKILPIGLLWLYISFRLLANADSFFVFDFFTYLFWGFIFFTFFLYNFYKDCRDYLSTGKISNFGATLTALCFIVSFFLIIYILDRQDRSPVVIQAQYDGIWIDLREDKTYKITNGSALGGNFYRGNYTIKGNVIELDRSHNNMAIQTNYLIIKPVQYLDSSYHDYIYQFNPEDRTLVNEHLSFKVLEDHRK